jgi:hypothetical protein
VDGEERWFYVPDDNGKIEQQEMTSVVCSMNGKLHRRASCDVVIVNGCDTQALQQSLL